MFKSLNLFKKLTPLAFLLLVGIFISSCGDDDVIGCTDSAAENFNAEANVSGDCVFARDQFLGTYVGTFTCADPLLAPIINSDSLVFTITEGVDDNPSNIVFNLVIEGFPIPLQGTVSGNVVTVDDMLEGVSIPGVELLPGVPVTITADVTGQGMATFTEINQTLAGTINITIDATSPFPVTAMDGCGLIGVKQE